MRRPLASPADRARSATLVALVHVGLAYALLTGLGVTPAPAELVEPLTLLDINEEEPAPPTVPMTPEAAPKPTERAKNPEGAAAPPALRKTPTPVVAPPPVVKLLIPPPLPASPLPGTGSAPNPGAAPVDGPGTGRGGEGAGLGAGRSGNGTGGDGGGGMAEGPLYVSGDIQASDLPRGIEYRQPQRVDFRLLIARDGRARGCRIARSSGIEKLDAATCAAAMRRLRWQPARDTAGRTIEAWAPSDFSWMPRFAPDQWVDPVEVRD